MYKNLRKLIVLGSASVLALCSVVLAQAPGTVLYEGDVIPAAAVPAWSPGGDISAGLVVIDAAAEDGFAYELPTVDSGGWSVPVSNLSLFNNATGWEVEIGHKAIFNDFGDMERHFRNDDSDHARISDGFLCIEVEFRPGQVRIYGCRVAPWNCSDLVNFCRLFSVPYDEYVTVSIIAQGNSYLATVNGQIFVGKKDRSIPKVLFFGNSSGPNRSIARWDYVRLFMGERDDDGDGVGNDIDVCPNTVIPEAVPTRSLGINRFALVDDDQIFDTSLPPGGGRGPGNFYAIADTAGCSCKQIVEVLGLGEGHERFGCSISAMEEWVSIVKSVD